MMLTALVCSLSLGAWGRQDCGPVGPVANADSGYEWRSQPSDAGRAYLYRHGVQVGGYDHEHGIYRRYDAARKRWGEPETPPWLERVPPQEQAGRVPNFGVDTDKLNGRHDESFRLNGQAVSREQARQALTGGRLPDDAQRLRLTVIGDERSRTRVSADVASAPALAEWKDRLVIQCYPPEHWGVARAGFVTSGRPTIYLQAPDGKVLHRQDDYDDGADGLATALRRADPNYDARKDPDLRRLGLRTLRNLAAIPLPAWLLAVGGLLAWLRGRRR